jgi:hypothetical protein
MSPRDAEEPYVKGPKPTWVQVVLSWIVSAGFLVFLGWDIYLTFTSDTSALEPVFDFLFVKHRAIALPLAALGLMVALFVDMVRSKRDPKLGMTRFWRVVCLIVLVIALFAGGSDYWAR